MEAKNFRIGNIVHLNGFIYEVMNGSFSTENIAHASVLEFVKGINLTEKWLLKFGFEKDGETYTKGFFSFYDFEGESCQSISYYHDSEMLGTYLESGRLKYVHQMQNLYFAITGEELELEEN